TQLGERLLEDRLGDDALAYRVHQRVELGAAHVQDVAARRERLVAVLLAPPADAPVGLAPVAAAPFRRLGLGFFGGFARLQVDLALVLDPGEDFRDLLAA